MPNIERNDSAMNPRWTQRPAGSTWGDFGPDDQLGRLNLLTPEKVLQGVAEVRAGRSFCLSLPLDYPGGTAMNAKRPPPRLQPTKRADGSPSFTYPMSRENPRLLDVMSDDTVELVLQYSTQWDSLAHAGQQFDANGDGRPEMVYYNGFRAGIEVVGPVDYRDGKNVPLGDHRGAVALGIENVAATGMQGRGVLLDFKAHYGETRVYVGYDRLMEIMEKDRVVVEEGDFLVIRTGFDEVLLKMNYQPDEHRLRNSFGILDGRDDRLLQWITDSGIVAIACDNNAVEASPARPCDKPTYEMLPLHAHCLFRLGVYLGEFWYLKELADWLRQNGRNRFLLTAPPLRLPGAVGSPVTPVATV
jgi:kynurenine formamidase